MKIKNACIIIAGLFLLAGCAPVGVLVGGSTKTYRESYQIKSSTPIDVYGKIDAVAEKTGFPVSGIDKEKGIVSFTKGVSAGAAIMIGSGKAGSISISEIGTKTLQINIHLVGNFDYGTKEKTDQLFNTVSSILQENELK
jgi:hypothetical protein